MRRHRKTPFRKSESVALNALNLASAFAYMRAFAGEFSR
jgi:hypothetical protein